MCTGSNFVLTHVNVWVQEQTLSDLEHSFGNFTVCVRPYMPWCGMLLIQIYLILYCVFTCIMHIRNTIRFLMVIKQIKNWIKVDSSGLWCNINPMLKHNERQWSNRDITYPEKLTNKCLGQVPWGAKVALMSTLESGLWVTLIQQLDGVVTGENDKQMDELLYLKWAPKNYVNTVEVDLNIL